MNIGEHENTLGVEKTLHQRKKQEERRKKTNIHTTYKFKSCLCQKILQMSKEDRSENIFIMYMIFRGLLSFLQREFL